jgi:uncharacterized protein (DUF427 family)
MSLLEPASGSSFCEWKGVARYWNLLVGDERIERAAWSYPEPVRDYADLADRPAFYAHLLDRCTVDGEPVVPQPGSFYGGWITSDLTGPFKGGPGTTGW